MGLGPDILSKTHWSCPPRMRLAGLSFYVQLSISHLQCKYSDANTPVKWFRNCGVKKPIQNCRLGEEEIAEYLWEAKNICMVFILITLWRSTAAWVISCYPTARCYFSIVKYSRTNTNPHGSFWNSPSRLSSFPRQPKFSYTATAISPSFRTEDTEMETWVGEKKPF